MSGPPPGRLGHGHILASPPDGRARRARWPLATGLARHRTGDRGGRPTGKTSGAPRSDCDTFALRADGVCAAPCRSPSACLRRHREVIFDDQGRAVALRITWTCDDLYSLAIIGDRGLDAERDGALTPEQATALAGIDMHRDAGFTGDTHALTADAKLTL